MSLVLKRFEEVNQKLGELYLCLQSGFINMKWRGAVAKGSDKCQLLSHVQLLQSEIVGGILGTAAESGFLMQGHFASLTHIPPPTGAPLEKETAIHSSILACESHGQRSLEGYSPWGCKGSDRTQQVTLSLSLPPILMLNSFKKSTQTDLHLIQNHLSKMFGHETRTRKNKVYLIPSSC